MDYDSIEHIVDLALKHGGEYEERLLKIFSPLIHSTARNYHSKHCKGLIELEDCVVYASMAFVSLTRRYDRSRCQKFVPYIKRFIQPQMQKIFESELHVPRRAYYRALKDGNPHLMGILFPDTLPD